MTEVGETSSPRRRLIETIVLVGLVTAFLVVSILCQKPFAKDANHREIIGIVIAAALTLIMYSFLYRDNPLFKLAENLYVGVGLGYSAVISWRSALRPEVYEPLLLAPTTGALLEALAHRGVPIILGLLLLTRLSRKRGWLSRYSYGLMVGWGAGVGITVVAHSFILRQLHAAIKPFQDVITGKAAAAQAFSWDWFLGGFFPVVGAVVLLVGTVTVLFYFFFSVEHKRVGRAVSHVGIWFLMLSFGASFGYTVMGRLSLLIGRVRFLLFDWLQISQ